MTTAVKLMEYEIESISDPIYQTKMEVEYLTELLQSSKNIKRDDRDKLLQCLEIIDKMCEN